jgi:hypothetical protein
MERGRVRAEDSEFSEEEGRAESGSGGGGKLGVRLIHGRDCNASRKKAVSLESLKGIAGLNSFKVLMRNGIIFQVRIGLMGRIIQGPDNKFYQISL